MVQRPATPNWVSHRASLYESWSHAARSLDLGKISTLLTLFAKFCKCFHFVEWAIRPPAKPWRALIHSNGQGEGIANIFYTKNLSNTLRIPFTSRRCGVGPFR